MAFRKKEQRDDVLRRATALHGGNGGVCQRIRKQGLPPGEFYVELTVDTHGTARGVLDLVWPEGFQPGITPPVCLVFDPEPDLEAAAREAGYRVFRNLDALKKHVLSDVLKADQETAIPG